MKALSIRSPWAWLILHGGKDIENRGWKTNFRGRVLIHVSKAPMTGYSDVITFAIQTGIAKDIPTYAEAAMQRGRIIGSVEIIDCVDRSKSPWFEGPFGFVLKDPRPIEPFSCNGRLKFFDVYREELGIK